MPKDSDRPKLVKWGTGLGLRLPAAELSELKLVRGTIVEVEVVNGALRIRAVPTFEEKLASMPLHAVAQDEYDKDCEV